jgi:uncharacterized membrane protein
MWKFLGGMMVSVLISNAVDDPLDLKVTKDTRLIRLALRPYIYIYIYILLALLAHWNNSLRVNAQIFMSQSQPKSIYS